MKVIEIIINQIETNDSILIKYLKKDGDQVTVKAAYSIEANKELGDYMNSKYHYLSISGENIRTSSNEVIQAIYSLTKVLDPSILVDPKF